MTTKPALLEDARGAAMGSYASVLAIGVIAVGALTNLGDAVGNNIADGAQSQAPTHRGQGVGSTNAAAQSDAPVVADRAEAASFDPVAEGNGNGSDVFGSSVFGSDVFGFSTSSNGANGSGNGANGSGTQGPVGPFPPGYASAPTAEVEPDPKGDLSRDLARDARSATRDMIASADNYYESLLNRDNDSLNAGALRGSRFSVEFPGRLRHTVQANFANQEPAEITAALDQLDREAWRARPLGDKPVAAWNHGDAVSALLNDFVLPPDFMDFLSLDGDSLTDDLFGNSVFDFLRGTDSTTTEPRRTYTTEELKGMSIRQIEHLSDQGLINPPTAADLQTEVDAHGAEVDKLNAQLTALDALEEATGRDLGYYRESLSSTLETTEDLKLMLQLEQARTAWDETHDGKSINAFSVQREMAPLEAEGVMADIRTMYQGGGETEQSAEELLLSIVGTDLHDASVQQILRQNEEKIQEEIDQLRSELPTEPFNFQGLALSSETFARSINQERTTVRAERKELMEQLKPLLDAHNAQHNKGELDGLDEGEWKQYQEREKKIKALTEQINALSAQDSEITDRLTAFNGNAALLSDAYQAVEAPKKFDEVKNPGFHKERPQGGLSYPVAAPQVTSPYGMRFHPVHKVNKLHTGTDFVPTNGDYRILAAQRGTVVYADYNGGFGNTVVVRHPDGSETSYSHLASFNVSQGQQVDRGQNLGQMGTTGTSTGIHLHFEYFAPGTIADNVTGYGASPGANYGRSQDCAGHLH